MATIVITDTDLGDGEIEREVLRGHELRVLGAKTAADVVTGAEGADALLVQWLPIDAGTLDALPSLRAIVRYGIGLDNIDLAAAEARGIRVSNVPDYCVDEVSAHALAFIVSRSRRLLDFRAQALNGTWSVKDVEPPRAPAGDAVGVAGLGRIGALLARHLLSLGHPVVAWDPYLEAWPDGVTRADTLVALAEQVNHLSLHVPLSDATRHVVGADVLRALGSNGHLVNTSRGGLVDEPALLAALTSGELGYASLDVLGNEPPTGVSARIVAHPNAFVTPHAAYYSDASKLRLQERAAETVLELLES